MIYIALLISQTHIFRQTNTVWPDHDLLKKTEERKVTADTKWDHLAEIPMNYLT